MTPDSTQTTAGAPVRSEALLGASGRPLSLTTDTPTPCCGSRLLIECEGTYRYTPNAD